MQIAEAPLDHCGLAFEAAWIPAVVQRALWQQLVKKFVNRDTPGLTGMVSRSAQPPLFRLAAEPARVRPNSAINL